MAKPCSVCSRSDRADIDAKLAAGTSLRSIAAETGMAKSSLDRHRRNCGLRHVVAVPAVVELLEPVQPVVSVSAVRPMNPLVTDALSARRSTEERQAILEHMSHETAVQAMEGVPPNITNARVKALKLFASTITLEKVATEARAKIEAKRKPIDDGLAMLAAIVNCDSPEHGQWARNRLKIDADEPITDLPTPIDYD